MKINIFTGFGMALGWIFDGFLSSGVRFRAFCFENSGFCSENLGFCFEHLGFWSISTYFKSLGPGRPRHIIKASPYYYYYYCWRNKLSNTLVGKDHAGGKRSYAVGKGSCWWRRIMCWWGISSWWQRIMWVVEDADYCKFISLPQKNMFCTKRVPMCPFAI